MNRQLSLMLQRWCQNKNNKPSNRTFSLERGGHWHWDHAVGLGWWVYASNHGRKKPKKKLMSIRQKRLKRERFL